MKKAPVALVWAVAAGSVLGASDSFELIKEKLGAEGCSYYEFISIVESDVFDDADTASGFACLASDGRYNVKVADEQYVYDLAYLYTYSASSNQVIIETPDSGAVAGEELSFITRLDDVYTTTAVTAGKRYHLVRQPDAVGDYPDSLDVLIDAQNLLLKQIRYFDVNGDLNIILFTVQDYGLPCADSLFRLMAPDSVETVRL
ncbi:MAG: outer membrane lipoprotein carrier protein LolA [Candidatus Zixiibacteriota bacterium]|nr:MAG: outer membrane lipoprotein carrier protein LolA [candidate division Zixibacteria bacterium]